MSSGIPELDAMLGGKGYYRGSTVLLSGTAGTGKTSMAASFIQAACRRGERCLWFAFEESEKQIIRNMRSIGIDLQPYADRKHLRFIAQRPTFYGLEMHLARIQKEMEKFDPAIVVMDPISNLISVGSTNQVRSMLTRLVDHLKGSGVTALMTDLGENTEKTNEQISSLVDTWLIVRNSEQSGERDRGLYIIKSRGMAHSARVVEFVLSNEGISLLEPYPANDGTLLTGRARRIQQTQDDTAAFHASIQKERGLRKISRKEEILKIRAAAAEARLQEQREEIVRQDADDAAVRQGAAGRGIAATKAPAAGLRHRGARRRAK